MFLLWFLQLFLIMVLAVAVAVMVVAIVATMGMAVVEVKVVVVVVVVFVSFDGYSDGGVDGGGSCVRGGDGGLVGGVLVCCSCC